MAASSRRTFLALTGVAATAAASAPIVAPMVAGASIAAPGGATGPARGRAGGAPLVAYVADASSDEVALMVGEREVVVHDPVLVDRLNAHLS